MRDDRDFLGGGCGCETHGDADGRLASFNGAATAGPGMPSRRRFLRTAAVTALGAPAVFAAACTSGSKPSGSAVAPQVPSVSSGSAPPSNSSTGNASGGPETADPVLLARKYQGLKPFAAAPPPPTVKLVAANVANTANAVLPPVVDHIPNLPAGQKICFLTIDDGLEKDPVFLDMVSDFKVPITLFLTDAMIKDDYGYFAKLRDTGYCTLQNHNLTHPNLVQASAQKQLAEISGQQAKLIQEYGTTPTLFRAPFGNSNKATQQACQQNGLRAIMYWRATFQKQGFQWQAADKKLRPGDILLSHFRGPKANGAGWPEMHQLMINLFRIVQEQGFTFARLEDYV